jgi:hypothetical protein
MTPIAKYYQFPRELWAGKEAAWDQGIQQADAQFKKLFVSSEELRRHRKYCEVENLRGDRALTDWTDRRPDDLAHLKELCLLVWCFLHLRPCCSTISPQPTATIIQRVHCAT